jgi:hypothetical protein
MDLATMRMKLENGGDAAPELFLGDLKRTCELRAVHRSRILFADLGARRERFMTEHLEW